VPPWYAWRLGYSPGLGSHRSGIFWWRGQKWFMHVRDPARTLVLHLKPGAGYDAVAVTLDDWELVVAELRRALEPQAGLEHVGPPVQVEAQERHR
jgi:hypothetical protein